MRIVTWQLAIGVVVGMVVVASAFAVSTHVDGGPHAPARDLLSISGSPEQLAARSERLAAHVCAVIEDGTACTMPALAAAAASDLRSLQAGYDDGQQALHAALIDPALDADAWLAVESAELARLDAGSRRYLQFLGDAAATLNVDQKRRFAH